MSVSRVGVLHAGISYKVICLSFPVEIVNAYPCAHGNVALEEAFNETVVRAASTVTEKAKTLSVYLRRELEFAGCRKNSVGGGGGGVSQMT